jgi:GTP-binding protein
MLPPDPEADPVRDARSIIEELRRYDESLYDKPRWLVLNKVDLLPEDERATRIEAFLDAFLGSATEARMPVHVISALTGEGCRELTFAIMEHLDTVRAREAATQTPEEEAS